MNSVFVKHIKTSLPLINYQSVRWRRIRKPFWLGIAKTKKFVIPQPKKIRSPEDENESKLLEKHYDTQLKSILNFIRTENPGLQVFSDINTGESKLSAELRSKIEESFKTNEEWNTESKKRREIRMSKNMEKEMENAIEKIRIEEENKEKHLKIVEEIVRKEKLLSTTYITPENLDEAVENCLNKIDCYDFAIDLEGNKYSGREVLPPKHSDDKRQINV